MDNSSSPIELNKFSKLYPPTGSGDRVQTMSNADGIHTQTLNNADGIHTQTMNNADGIHTQTMNNADGIHTKSNVPLPLVLLLKRNTLILYSYFHQTFFLLLRSVTNYQKVIQLSKPWVSDFGTTPPLTGIIFSWFRITFSPKMRLKNFEHWLTSKNFMSKRLASLTTWPQWPPRPKLWT